MTDSTFIVAVNAQTGNQKLSDDTGSEVPTTPLDPVTNLTTSNITSVNVDVSWSYNGSGHDGFDFKIVAGGQEFDYQLPTRGQRATSVRPCTTA